MNRILAAVLAGGMVLASGSMALADGYDTAKKPGKDDMVQGAPYRAGGQNWSGIYVGGQVGYGWGNMNANNNNNTLGFPTFSEGFSPDGAFLGGQIGIQHQTGSLVYGADFAFVGSGFNESHGGPFNATQSDKLDIRNIGMLTGRLGYAHDRWLAYVKGGYAFGTTTWTRTNTNFYEEVVSRHNGYVWGGGVDTKIDGNWTLGLDYSYVHLNDKTNQGLINGGPAVYEVTTKGNEQMVGLRLNYLFGR